MEQYTRLLGLATASMLSRFPEAKGRLLGLIGVMMFLSLPCRGIDELQSGEVTLGESKASVVAKKTALLADLSRLPSLGDNVEVIHFVTKTRPSQIKLSVWFRDGKAIKIEGPALRFGTENLTAGMSDDECISRLGKPSESAIFPATDCTGEEKLLRYKYGDKQLTLVLSKRRGRWILDSVSLKLSEINW